MSVHLEVAFEKEVCEYLGQHGWLYEDKTADSYDRKLALYPSDLTAWLEESQQDAWETYQQKNGSKAEANLLQRIREQLDQQGTLDLLRNGIEVMGLPKALKLAEFKPALGLNPDILARYNANRLRVVRQVRYSLHNENCIDLVLFLNGIPVATVELKTDNTQSIEDAVWQYKTDRLPKLAGKTPEPLLSFPSGALVHFAVSTREVRMTTKLAGPATVFLPFNKGSDPGGKNCGAGNPIPDGPGYPTDYLWQEVWERDSWLEILGRYCIAERNKKKQISKILFPRYHQLAVTRLLQEAVRQEGAGQKYLIQHPPAHNRRRHGQQPHRSAPAGAGGAAVSAEHPAAGDRWPSTTAAASGQHQQPFPPCRRRRRQWGPAHVAVLRPMNTTTTSSHPSATVALMSQQALVSRSWNGTPISRRTSDGYVNATAMCKANKKRWSDYRESDRCQLYLDALSQTTEIPVFDLIQSRQGHGGGTWVHPQVAVDLARWISAPFAVWMDGWFLESVQQAQSIPVETHPARIREADVIALVERSICLFERLGGLDQRDQLLFKDIVRSNVLTASAGLLPGAPTDEELTLGDAWLEVFQQALPRSQFCAAGRLVARAYREEFGEEPPCRQQFVDGAPRQVKSYRRSWLVDTLQRCCAQPAGS